MVLEKTLESPLDCKEVKPVNPKENQPWILIGMSGAEAPIRWLPDWKNWLRKRPWRWERLRAGGDWDDRGWDGWMASPTQWTWVLSKLWEMVKDREVWCAAVHGGGKELDTTWRLNNKIVGRGQGCFCWFYGVSSVNQASIKGWLCPICSI